MARVVIPKTEVIPISPNNTSHTETVPKPPQVEADTTPSYDVFPKPPPPTAEDLQELETGVLQWFKEGDQRFVSPFSKAFPRPAALVSTPENNADLEAFLTRVYPQIPEIDLAYVAYKYPEVAGCAVYVAQEMAAGRWWR